MTIKGMNKVKFMGDFRSSIFFFFLDGERVCGIYVVTSEVTQRLSQPKLTRLTRFKKRRAEEIRIF